MQSNYRYYTIAQEILEYIRSHNLTPGAKIPGIRKLAEMFACGKNTVMAAFDYLTSEGIIEPIPKQGNFVAPGAWKEMNSHTMWLKYKERGWQAEHGDAFKTHFMSVDQYEIIPGVLSVSSEFNSDKYIAHAMKDVGNLISHNPLMNEWSKYGLRSAREALCTYLNNKGIQATPDTIIFTTGSTNSLNIINQAFLSKGMYMLTTEPSSYPAIAAPHLSMAGATVVSIPMDNEGILIDPLMKQQYFGRSILVLSSVHQYPTGLSMSNRRKEQLLNACIEMQIPIIEIDSYSDCVPYNSIKTMDNKGGVIYCGSLRHMFAMGLNVGWIVAPPYYMNRILDITTRQSLYQPNLNHLIIEMLLKNGHYDTYLQNLKSLFHDRVQSTHNLLNEYLSDYVSWNKEHCGFLFWLKLDGINADHLLNSLKNILITEGALCSPNYQDYFSICPFSLTEQELELSIKTIATGIKQLLDENIPQHPKQIA